jgi:hypothetical protein
MLHSQYFTTFFLILSEQVNFHETKQEVLSDVSGEHTLVDTLSWIGLGCQANSLSHITMVPTFSFGENDKKTDHSSG